MLFGRHALLHLHNGVIWSTLHQCSANHMDDLEKCAVHLCYLGRGLFVELVECEALLKILEDSKDNIQSLVVGELTPEEASTVD